MSVVIAELSALKFSASNTRLMGIAAGRRSDRRGTEGKLIGIGNPSGCVDTADYDFMLYTEWSFVKSRGHSQVITDPQRKAPEL